MFCRTSLAQSVPRPGPGLARLVVDITGPVCTLLTRRRFLLFVVSRPILAPVALIEHATASGLTLRVLVFRPGVLPAPVVALLGRLLHHL